MNLVVEMSRMRGRLGRALFASQLALVYVSVF